MSDTLWVAPECDEALVQNLAKESGISEVLARLLINRGITTADEVRAFLSPSLDHLHDPMLLPDMEKGVERTALAIANNEKILIHGDYDVDGVTSTALLVRTLSRLGANVVYRVPHRKREGYDIKPWSADEAHAEGVTLIITADCGVTACETIERAETLGIDIVVTDHHEPGEHLPKAVAVINPMRHDSTYPFPHLAGVGVALKFAQALVRRLGHDDKKFITKFLDLAALGTVADVMPLIGENRAIVKYGLEQLAKTKKLGLQAMLERAAIAGKKLTSYHIGFILGPRINSVGRMDDAAIALKLLLTADEDEAGELVDVLEERNQERQTEQARVLKEALELLSQIDFETNRAIVLAAEGWNSGVVGIVASKVVDRYRRPTILLTINQEAGTASGSARSIDSFNMISAIDECRSLLEKAGGHALAAGVSLKAVNIKDFTEKLNDIATRIITDEDLIPKISVDGEISPDEVSWELLREINRLEPFGQGNPEPIFISRGLEVLNSKRVGSDGSHLKLRVKDTKGMPIDCIGFGFGDQEEAVQLGPGIDLCYNIRSNSYNGSDTIQLMIKDIKSE